MTDFTNPEGLDGALDDEALDLEIQENESGLVELLDGDKTSGTLRNSIQTGDLATIRGGVTDIETVAEASVEYDHDTSLGVEAEKLFNQLEADMANATLEAVTANPHQAGELAGQMSDGVAAINDLRSNPAAVEIAIIQRASEVPLVEAARDTAAWNIGARNEIVRMLDEQGMADRILDVAGMFIPARTTMEGEDVKDGVQAHKQLSAFMTGDSIASMITSWQALPLERKKVLYPALTELVFSASGIEGTDFGPIEGSNLTDQNMVLGASMLMRFLDPEGGERASRDQKIDLGLEALSFAPAVFKAVKNVNFAAFKGAGKAGTVPPKGPASPSSTVASDGIPLNRGTELTTPNEFRPLPEQAALDGTKSIGTTTDAGLARISQEVSDLPVDTRKAMESVLTSSGELGVKQHNTVKVIATAGDKRAAARMNFSAMSDTDVARAVGLTSDEAVENAMPFQTQDWLPQVTQGLIPEMGAVINNFYRTAAKQVSDVTTQSTRTRIGALTQVDRDIQKTTFKQEAERKGEDMMFDGITMDNIKITGEDTEAFTFEYTITDSTGTTPRTIQGRRSWSAGRVTTDYTATAEDLAKVSASTIPGLSPSTWSMTKPGSSTDFNDVVKQSIQLEDLDVAISDDIASMWREANVELSGITTGVGKEARAKLNAIEIAGDEYVNPLTSESGKVFLPEELIARGITEPELQRAYYKRRLVADAMHNLQNYTVRRELELTGFKRSVRVGRGADMTELYVKPFEDVGAAKSSLAAKEGYGIYDAVTGKIFTATDTHIDQVYADGRMIVRSHEDWNTSGNDLNRGAENVEYIAVQVDQVRALPEQVIHYKVGYVPKASKHVEFVVQRDFPVNKRGAAGKTKSETLRAFSSKVEADQFLETQIVNHMAKHDISREAAERMYSRTDGKKLSQVDRATNSLSGSAGLFKGTRAKDELLMGLEGRPLERLQPEEVMGRWLQHVSTGITRNEMRVGKEQEWLNTVRRTMPEVRIQGFEGTVLPQGDARANALEKLRRQLRIWNTSQTTEETLFEAGVQATHDWVMTGENKLGLSTHAADSILFFKHKNLLSSVKAANMHILLGVGNVSQLFVQASAMTVALSQVNSVAKIPGILQKGFQFGMLDNMMDTSARTRMIAQTAEALGYENPALLDEAYTAWKRSGMFESVRGNADLSYASSTGLGLTKDVMRSGQNASLFVYRMGELFNRRISYITAFDNWRTANPTKVVDDFAESDILKLANQYMFELNGANRAWWQGGNGASTAQQVAGVSTQFMQVMAKTIEVAAKGESRGGFNAAQKRRLFLGQILAFGTAGVPLVSMLGAGLADLMTAEDTSPEDAQKVANTINQGFAGFVSRELVGADVQVSNRMSVTQGVTDMVGEIVTSDDPNWQVLMGVSSTLLDRGGELFSVLAADLPMFTPLGGAAPLFSGARNEEMTGSDSKAALVSIANALMLIPSSTRNALKARLMRNENVILSRRGVRLEEDFNTMTEVAQALGFQTNEEGALFAMRTQNFDNKAAVNDSVELMLAAYHRYIYTHKLDPSYGQQLINFKTKLEDGLENPVLVQDFRRAVESRILNTSENERDRALNEYFRTTLPGEVTEAYLQHVDGQIIAPFADLED